MTEITIFDLAFQVRFWTKVVRRPGCWIWLGARNNQGYGNFGSQRLRPRHRKAHRISWELAHGAIPPGLCVLHHCDNPPCVNPDHLFLGTKQDNVDDMMRKGRHVPPPGLRGEQLPHTKLTWAQVAEIRRLAAERPRSGSMLARRFGVHPRTVNDLLHGKNWKVQA
jgi:hypothetical protein